MTSSIAQRAGPGSRSADAAAPVPWTLSALSLPMLLSALGTSMANVALPALTQVFTAPFQQVQWVVLAYLLAITSLVVTVGRLGDLVGRRRLLLGGTSLFTAAAVLCGLAPTLGWLIAARTAQGVGAAIMMAITTASIGDTVPKEKTGKAMGLLGTMSAIGTALGPSLGGLLIAGSGWRAVFLINVPLGILAITLVHRFLPRDRPRTTGRTGFDLAGTLLLALTLAAYALALTVGRGHVGRLDALLLCSAFLGAGLFVLVESRASSPLIHLAMLRDTVLSSGFAMSAVVTTVVMATLVVGPFYLAGALALDAAGVGLAMSCGPIVAAIAGVPAGHLIDRLGPQRMTIAGLLAMAAGCALLVLMPMRFGVPGYVAPLVTITAGYALFQAANTTAVMAGVRPDQRGVTSGLLNLSRNLGLITGASVLGAVFALAAGTNDVVGAAPAAIAAGMRTTFGVAVVLVVVALIIGAAGRGLAQRSVRSREQGQRSKGEHPSSQ